MSLDQIRAFVTVAETGSVRRAASRLHLTQPPVSRQIASLEDELGARLFERIPAGMRLAPAGAVFLAHARRILDEVEAARRAVVGADDDHDGSPARLTANDGAARPASP